MKQNLHGVLMALLSFGIFATHDVFVKFLGGLYSPFQIIFFSVLLTFPLVTVMMMRDVGAGNLRPNHPWWTAARTLAVVFTGISAFYAFSVLPLAQTYAILFASPLLITVLAIPILGETVRLRRWAAVTVGLIGVLVVLRPGGTDMTLGHLAALAAAVCGAFSAVIMRKIGNDERSEVLLIYPMVANYIVMASALPFIYRPMPASHFGMIAIVSAFGFFGGLCLISAYRRAEAAIVAPMQYSQILWATFYGFLLFDETPDQPTIIGASVIIASGLYIVFRESRPQNSETTPVLTARFRLGTPTSFRFSQIRKRMSAGK